MNNLFDIKGRVVVITGSTGVLGRTISAYLAQEGAKVVLLGRNVEVGTSLEKDIKQKGGDVHFTLANLNFEAVGAICEDPDYKKRVQFVASAKVPTLKLKLSAGVDSLRQCKIFIQHYARTQ